MSKQLEKKIALRLAPYISALGVHRLFIPRYGGRGQILMFHRVVPNLGGPRIHNHESLEITVTHLETVIRYYKKRDYAFLSLDQLPAFLQNTANPRKFVIFTFDDGYLDNYQYAAPVFEKHHIPYTIYVTTDFPDRKAILWWYYLEELLLRDDKIIFSWKGRTYQYRCEHLEAKEKVFYVLRNLFIEASVTDETAALLKVLFKSEKFEPCEKTEELTLNWQQIRELSTGTLATIGAHTVSHLPLSKMNQADALSEILLSKEKLEDCVSKSVLHFSYPFGTPNEAGEREFNLVKDCGFLTATTTRFSTLHPEHIHHLTALPRITINMMVSPKVLDLCTSGFLPALGNHFRRVVIG
jgi:peptidoglycan/xylan/chitin deacetylase (PgdA/CDA1 family)